MSPMQNDCCQEHLKQKEDQWEALCARCGGCCGAFDDPCRHLAWDGQGRSYCEIYCVRFGLRQTISGDKFSCVPVKEILHTFWKNEHLCAYKKIGRSLWEA